MKEKAIIIPGIDNGTIPMNIMPEDLAGTMTAYYDRIFDREKKTPAETKWFVTFLITVFGFITVVGTLYTLMHVGFARQHAYYCLVGEPIDWWKFVNDIWWRVVEYYSNSF